MKFNNVYLSGLSAIDPVEFLTSQEIETMLEPLYSRLNLPEGRLELISGVQRRGFWPEKTRPSEISTLAAESLLEKSSLKRTDIDLLINASVCKDYEEPSTTSFIHQNLKLSPKALCFDVANACLGMVSSMNVAASMIEAGSISHALITSGENSYQLTHDTIKYLNESETLNRKEIKSSLASLTISSAGAAMLLSSSKSRNSKSWKLESIHTRSDSRASDLCLGGYNDGKLLMKTQSEKLLKAGVQLAKDNWLEFVNVQKNYSYESDKIIMHQVGRSHRDMIIEELGLNKENQYSIFKNFGNSGSASIISCLHKACEDKFIQDENVVLLGIGSGLNTTAAYLRSV